ncbi:uncharacterized protein LOC117176735 isoform X2 [Belonocnema kinseyi]|uniref:uncharacterized protein LOC117176735 isoform X2 n=1 Tax=Belonocnema kinseyi TaxID=2817044 RepID=UPI00143CC859|nr:uncharacterized protein LOC117176735 isoform X2 [Belonocnema kinseyi]
MCYEGFKGEPPETRSIVAYSWARRLALDYRNSKDCDGNGSSRMTSDGHSTKWLETIPGQLFLYSAHLDIRVAAYPSVRVIGVKRGLLQTSPLFCTIWYEEDGRMLSLTVDALISDIWLEEWGGTTTDGYIGILATCSFPSSKSIEPISIYVGPIPCYEDPSHSLVIPSIDKINPTIRRQFTLCIKGLDFEDDVSEKLIAFVELHRILGASFFHFYVFDVHANVLKVLSLYERSNVVRWHNLTLPGDLPNDKEGRRMLFEKDVWIKRRMELIPYNHCLYENLHKSEFVVPIDMDETIVPLRRKHWSQLLLDERIKLGKSFKDYASYAVRNAYFFPEIQKKNGSLKNGMQNVDYLDSIRTSIISPEGDSIKSFVSTKRTLTVHNHYALSTLNPAVKRTHHFNSKDVLKHHHRVCDEQHLDCDLLMEDVRVDNSALRYADELGARMKIALSNLEKIE